MIVHYKSISELKRLHAGHFFDRDTIRFFDSVIYPNVRTGYDGWYFITSEKFDTGWPRLFTIRKIDENGKIDTVGKFQGYQTFEDALKSASEFAKAEREGV